ncbi:ABC transporter substrate-binding protein [Lutispora thermophila]|uniref:Spermidine/putrescine transport system substrate-binding protein n=1 Tax=Lutispora thermophila DSM 19022 TaxID=1122184 RepID=A0A1M6CC16_9FIRM|nr:spermidine/putrescine ABC transporter substrate-binding protein [Lutispora thermophila]SHI58552.1 spermidine/putrescine transport system substrate-binding protein [Lutispora thermophila DSM 19022]
MKKSLKAILALTLAISVVLSMTGCGGEQRTQLKVYNWGDYIDQSVITEFEKRYNIDVIYDEFATNEEMYAKIKAGASDYDILIPSEYTIKRMIDEDMLHKIDLNNIPNYKYIDDKFKNLAFDPSNEYSVPYTWGTVGILYNKTMVKEPVNSWKILWDEKYSKQILMMDSLRDSIGITLKMLGYSLNTKDDKELNDAKEALMKQKPLVLAYVGDEVKDKMIGGEAALAVVWSGDAMYMKRENPDLEYVVPKEGSNMWFDSVVIPKTSQHKKEAELFINFLCEPEIAYKIANYIGYSTPNTEAVKMLPEEVRNDKTAYPPDEELARCEVFEDLADSLVKYDRIWTEVKAQ